VLTINALTSGSWVNDPVIALPGTSQTFYNLADGVIRYQGNGGIFFNGFADGIDNQGLIEVLSSASWAASTDGFHGHVFSSGAPGTMRANGADVVWTGNPLVDNNALNENQNIQAVNGAAIVFNSFNVKNVTITSDAASSLRGGGGAVTGVGTPGQDVSALTTFSNATLTGATTVLKLQGSDAIALDGTSPSPSNYGLIVTNNAQLQLTGAGVVYSSVGGSLGRILVDNGGLLIGAGSTTPHQFGLTVGSGGHLVAGNSPTTSSTVADQTLRILGDVQMAPTASFAVTLFGDNLSSLLSVGSAGTPASLLGGNLIVNIAASYTPSAGSHYVVFQENSIAGYTGTFANAVGSVLSANGLYQFGVSYDHTLNQVVLGVTAVPEPSSYALMIAGGAAMGLVLRRRRRGDTN